MITKTIIMKRLLLPILILSFSFASAQGIVSNQEVSEDNVTTVTLENVVINDDKQDELAYTPKTLRDPDNIALMCTSRGHNSFKR